MNRPKRYVDPVESANAIQAAGLPCLLAASRFVHYIKVILRNKVGSFLTRRNVEAYLNDWIAQYVLLDGDAAPEIRAAFPLCEASIVLTDVTGEQPGVYQAAVSLKLSLPPEEPTIALSLQIAA